MRRLRLRVAPRMPVVVGAAKQPRLLDLSPVVRKRRIDAGAVVRCFCESELDVALCHLKPVDIALPVTDVDTACAHSFLLRAPALLSYQADAAPSSPS